MSNINKKIEVGGIIVFLIGVGLCFIELRYGLATILLGLFLYSISDDF